MSFLDDYKYLFQALFFLGVAIAIIKWIGRTMTDISGGRPRDRESTEDRLERLFHQTGAASYLSQTASPPPDPKKIAEHEREARAMEDALRASAHAPIAPGATPALPHAGRMTGAAILLHCPVCAKPLSEVPTPLPFAVECLGCHRRINARGDGPGRISVVAIEPRKSV